MFNIDMRKLKADALHLRHDFVLIHLGGVLRRVAAHLRSEDRIRGWDEMTGLSTWCYGVLAGLDIPYGWCCRTPKRILNLQRLLREVQEVSWHYSEDTVSCILPSPEALETLAARAESMTNRTEGGGS